MMEAAVVRALFGEIPFQGRLPITIPGFAERGTGIQKAAVATRMNRGLGRSAKRVGWMPVLRVLCEGDAMLSDSLIRLAGTLKGVLMKSKYLILAAGFLTVLSLSGCTVRSNKNPAAGEKNIDIRPPFGPLGVKKGGPNIKD